MIRSVKLINIYNNVQYIGDLAVYSKHYLAYNDHISQRNCLLVLQETHPSMLDRVKGRAANLIDDPYHFIGAENGGG